MLVSAQDDGSYLVKVRDGRVETSHVVAVPPGWGAVLGVPGASGDELVRASFAFLLEREPGTSVLPRFSLEVIERYFPEYRAEVLRYLSPDQRHLRPG